MNKFNKKLSKKPSFSQKGLEGYKFPTKNSNVEVYFLDVKQGHEAYFISKKCTHIYYVIEGEGFFDIDGSKHEAKSGMLFELPPNVEYTYSGKMKLLLIMNPPWFEGNEEIIKKNPSVK
jgi:mannose-6-phosphate isomerase-like protein (cupin superfamily)